MVDANRSIKSNQMWIYIAHCQKISNALGTLGLRSWKKNVLSWILQAYGIQHATTVCHTGSNDKAHSGVARICCEEGQSCKFGHEALTVDFRAGCSSCSMTNSFLTDVVLMERTVSCWHLHQLISQTTQYLDGWLSDLLQTELQN